MNCKYFLLFHFISLCFILLTSAIIPALTFCFSLYLESDPKIFAETAVKGVSTCFFYFFGFRSSTQGNAFWVQFSTYCKIVVQFACFAYKCPVFPTSFIAETVLTYLLYFWLVCCCRREWQTTSVFLPWESHENYERQKDMILKD